jgi:hypothetical protein
MDEALRTEHEAGLVGFVEPASRHRMRHALKSDRARSKFNRQLAHFPHLDLRFAIRTGDKARLAGKLRKLGAPDLCYVMSESQDIDGRMATLEDAIRSTVEADGGSLISCIPGKLCAYVGEDPNSAWILQRPAEK